MRNPQPEPPDEDDEGQLNPGIESWIAQKFSLDLQPLGCLLNNNKVIGVVSGTILQVQVQACMESPLVVGRWAITGINIKLWQTMSSEIIL